MKRLCCGGILGLLAAGSVEGTRTRASLRRTLRASDYEDTPYCAFGPAGSFDGQVQIFVGKDNTRSVAFGTDGMGTQTEVKCNGELPSQCAGPRTGSVNNTQSCDYLGCGCQRDNTSLEFVYMKKMMQEVEPICSGAEIEHPGDHFRMLLVGLGGGALPAYTLAHCPDGSKVESVEYDPRIISAATQFFGFNIVPGSNEVENNDGLVAVQDRAQKGQKYDVVLVDCFQAGGKVPDHCSNKAFVHGVRSILKPGGKAIQQVWAPQKKALVQTYETEFGKDQTQARNVEFDFNFLIIGQSPAASP